MFVGDTITLQEIPRRNDGSEGSISTVPGWSADLPLVTLVPSADGTTCDVTGLAAGTVTITCQAFNTADPAVAVAGTKVVLVILPPADFLEIVQI